MSGQPRISYIDTSKAIAIFLVILGHVVDVGTPMKTGLYTFHMPLFFMLTGMTYKWLSDKSWQTIKARLVRYAGALLIPYVIFALFYSKLTYSNIAFIGYSSWHALKLAGSLSSLWFLMALFMSHVYLLLLHKVLPRQIITTPIALSIIALFLLVVGAYLPYGGKYGYPWMTNVAFVGAAFIMIGLLLHKMFDYYAGLNIAWRLGAFLVATILFVVTIPFNHPSPGYVLMADGLYGNVALFAVIAILGATAVIMFSQISDVILSRCTPLMWIGKNTLGIFLVHKFFINGAHIITNKMGMDYNNVTIACILSVMVLLVSCIVVTVINRFVPFLLHYEKR